MDNNQIPINNTQGGQQYPVDNILDPSWLSTDASIFGFPVLSDFSQQNAHTGQQVQWYQNDVSEVKPFSSYEGGNDLQSQNAQHEYPPMRAILVLNITPFAGPHNFSAMIPTSAVRNKWYYSSTMNRLYTGKNVPFPVKLSMTNIQNSTIVLCPVYANTEKRTCIVKRCPTCRMEDPSDPYANHLMRVEGAPCTYDIDPNGHKIIRIPLTQPSTGEEDTYIHMKMVCRTSCPGGPNRRMFVILVLLINSNGAEVGRDVIDVKCCESAARDMQNDEKRHAKELSAVTCNKQEITEIVSSLGNPNKKRKMQSDNDEVVLIPVPKIDEAKVREYMNMLRCTRLCDKILKKE